MVRAEEPPCGVRKVTQSTTLDYPGLARSAHEAGVVVVRANITQGGTVESAEVWQGPPMLRQASLDFVRGLRANEYGGSRTCLFSITFRIDERSVPNPFHNDLFLFLVDKTSTDPLHYTISGRSVPAYTTTDHVRSVRKKFLGIF
jgi:hypothetical protein